MLTSFALVVAGLLLLCGGAEILVRGAAGMALRLGITPLVVGLTIVAFGTSSPELFVSTKASLVGQGSLALGTVVGSNICNILLILGVGCLIRPIKIHLQVLRVDLPIMVAASVLLAVMLWAGELTRLYGVGLIAGVILYTWFTIRLSKRDAGKKDAESFVTEQDKSEGPGLWLVILMVAGAGLLVVGTDMILKGAVDLATRLGISEAVIGLTLIAVGGSLPELATTVSASIGGNGDIAVGNVVGSNIFNILCVLGVASTARAIPVSGIEVADVFVMLGVSVLMVPLMKSGFSLKRWEGVMMLLLYAIYVASLAVR